ncbi:MAG TPA: hypothetical protein VLL51_07605 [Gemmatimonadales bacterium]|nr:hypothetical protein [Gemmatimonadales bacterium]
MVTRILGPRRGASKFGCLLSLLLFAAAILYGGQIGRIYWRYYEFVDEMRLSARFARNRTDETIRRTLWAKVDELGLPEEARRIQIRRTGPPPRITVSAQYREQLDLPLGGPVYIPFRPRVESGF